MTLAATSCLMAGALAVVVQNPKFALEADEDVNNVVTITSSMLEATALNDFTCHNNADKKFTISLENGKCIDGALLYSTVNDYQNVGANLGDSLYTTNHSTSKIGYNYNIFFEVHGVSYVRVKFKAIALRSGSQNYRFSINGNRFYDSNYTDLYSEINEYYENYSTLIDFWPNNTNYHDYSSFDCDLNASVSDNTSDVEELNLALDKDPSYYDFFKIQFLNWETELPSTSDVYSGAPAGGQISFTLEEIELHYNCKMTTY